MDGRCQWMIVGPAVLAAVAVARGAQAGETTIRDLSCYERALPGLN